MATAQLFERVESVDVATANMAQLASSLTDLNRIDGWVSVRRATITRRLTELEAAGQAPPADDVLARSGRISARQAAKDKRRAEAYGKAPALGKQRAAGRISDEHADALANTASKLDEDQQDELFSLDDELAEQAASSTPAQFARHLSKLADKLSSDYEAIDRSEAQRDKATLSHGINETSGMGWVRAELHPDDLARCSGPAQLTAAKPASTRPKSIISWNGTAISAPPTSSICCRSASFITIEHMRGDGDCNSTRAPENSPCSFRTATSTAAAYPTCLPNEAISPPDTGPTRRRRPGIAFGKR